MEHRVLSYGSLNIDRVYSVPHMVRPGETMSSTAYNEYVGGKGLNQSIALARSGMKVYHAGAVGSDGEVLLETLKEDQINIEFVKQTQEKSGHAIIQVDDSGQNSILLFSGANFSILEEDVEGVFDHFASGDILLIQNEINCLKQIIDLADKKGMRIFFNPSPFNEDIFNLPLEKIDWFLLNEIEAQQITQMEVRDDDLLVSILKEHFPQANFVITLGEQGSMCSMGDKLYRQSIYPTEVVDTTGAGDTFTGYFISTLLETGALDKALDVASKASSISVSRKGASSSIPYKEEVEND